MRLSIRSPRSGFSRNELRKFNEGIFYPLTPIFSIRSRHQYDIGLEPDAKLRIWCRRPFSIGREARSAARSAFRAWAVLIREQISRAAVGSPPAGDPIVINCFHSN